MKILYIVIVVGFIYGFTQSNSLFIPLSFSEAAESHSETQLQNAFKNHQSGLHVQGAGKVIRLLPDDNDGSRHQRFILQMPGGQTLLVAHNIDLAPRINNLQIGDTVEFRGDYEWNSKGGVIHWTHHDPDNSHPDGWLKHRDRLYQ